jgi:hypothetical protein
MLEHLVDGTQRLEDCIMNAQPKHQYIHATSSPRQLLQSDRIAGASMPQPRHRITSNCATVPTHASIKYDLESLRGSTEGDLRVVLSVEVVLNSTHCISLAYSLSLCAPRCTHCSKAHHDHL